jgi:hypothetical protein
VLSLPKESVLNFVKQQLTEDPSQVFLCEKQLRVRWGLRYEKKLQADRGKGIGCPYVKLGGVVRYRLSDVIEYELAQQRRSTSDRGGV